jgi:hypothetical protein
MATKFTAAEKRDAAIRTASRCRALAAGGSEPPTPRTYGRDADIMDAIARDCEAQAANEAQERNWARDDRHRGELF